MTKPQTTSTLFPFCRLFSWLTDESQNPTAESKLSSEQIFFCSALCELASLLMHITWSENTQEQRKAILSSSAFTQCKLISSAKSCVYGVLCVNIITLSNALHRKVLQLISCSPKCVRLLIQNLVLHCLLCWPRIKFCACKMSITYLKRSSALSVIGECCLLFLVRVLGSVPG